MSDCVTIYAEHTREEFPPAVLEPEGEMVTAPMSTDKEEKKIRPINCCSEQYLA